MVCVALLKSQNSPADLANTHSWDSSSVGVDGISARHLTSAVSENVLRTPFLLSPVQEKDSQIK